MVLLVGVAVVVVRGSFSSVPEPLLRSAAGRRAAPGWTRDCRSSQRSSSTAACERVTGTVVWIQRHDPDGDGDRHLVVVTGFHLHVVKVVTALRALHLPRIGQLVTAVGYDLRGSEHDQEIRAGRLAWRGHVYLLGDRH